MVKGKQRPTKWRSKLTDKKRYGKSIVLKDFAKSNKIPFRIKG